MTVLGTAPSHADEFCDVLKTVVAAAPSDFQAVRGRPRKDDLRTYDHPLALPGARWIIEGSPGCVVSRQPDTPPTFTYSCSFFGGGSTLPEAHSALVGFTSRVATCLDVSAPQIDQSASLAFRPYRLSYAQADVTITLVFLPDGGDGLLSLNIGKAK